jgi:hypothetical protein
MKNSIFCGVVDLADMELEYYIIEENLPHSAESYGIKVVKTQFSEGGGTVSESKEIGNVFYRRKDAEKFIKLIRDNKVTPMTLMDVVEDYIIDYFLA